jgi:hypothetical protein
VTSGTLFSICRARGATATLPGSVVMRARLATPRCEHHESQQRVHGHSLLSVVYIAWEGDPVAERQQDDDPTS